MLIPSLIFLFSTLTLSDPTPSIATNQTIPNLLSQGINKSKNQYLQNLILTSLLNPILIKLTNNEQKLTGEQKVGVSDEDTMTTQQNDQKIEAQQQNLDVLELKYQNKNTESDKRDQAVSTSFEVKLGGCLTFLITIFFLIL